MSEQRQPVAVAVAAHMVKKPDRTGLPDTSDGHDVMMSRSLESDMEISVDGFGFRD